MQLVRSAIGRSQMSGALSSCHSDISGAPLPARSAVSILAPMSSAPTSTTFTSTLGYAFLNSVRTALGASLCPAPEGHLAGQRGVRGLRRGRRSGWIRTYRVCLGLGGATAATATAIAVATACGGGGGQQGARDGYCHDPASAVENLHTDAPGDLVPVECSISPYGSDSRNCARCLGKLDIGLLVDQSTTGPLTGQDVGRSGFWLFPDGPPARPRGPTRACARRPSGRARRLRSVLAASRRGSRWPCGTWSR